MEQEPCWGQRDSLSTYNLLWLPVTFFNKTSPTRWFFWQMWRWTARLQLEKAKKEIQERDRTTDTFKNGQPCRVMREPDRIARQAGVLPSVIKRHISQLEDFHFLVRGVKASSLENNIGSRPNKRPKRGKGTMSKGFWKRKGMEERSPPPSNTICQKSTNESPYRGLCQEEPSSIC